MQSWAEILADDLNSAERGLSEAVQLVPGIPADQFEETLGSLFALQSSMELVKRFRLLGGPQPGSIQTDANTWIDQMETRLSRIVEALRTSLYREFGRQAIDAAKAEAAAKSLLSMLQADKDVVFATTNYDPSLELGLARNGIAVQDGFTEGAWESPVLAPDELVRWPDSMPYVPVLHLHGAVGWYVAPDGRILRFHPDQPYNPTLGVPAILPPDPAKDPTKNPYVQSIWAEFTKALTFASHILVLGHSLHDPALVEALLQVPTATRLAVTHHAKPSTGDTESGDDVDPSQAGQDAQVEPSRISLLERSSQFYVDLGPTPVWSGLDRWATQS
jgi:SIR2-like domain